MPQVSVIVPTYNRADTIRRAIESVKAQTFDDWELIVVDDGSDDDTASIIEGLAPRMTVIRQENRGFGEARNAGIHASSGKYLAFLDSDDEFLPHHLELGIAFLEGFPDETFVSAELLEDFGGGRFVNHYRAETSEWYPQKAHRLRSRAFQLPPGETDDYLRVYESREPIGDWGNHIVKKARTGEGAFLYRGRIFKRLRWGYLMALPATVTRRAALETVGLPDASYRIASDFHFMGTLCRHFRANFLSLPTYIKHELTTDGKAPAESHVATGATVLQCKKDMLRAYDDLFWKEDPQDRDLLGLRALRQLGVAQVALQAGERDTALQYLKAARQSLPHFWEAVALESFVKVLPGAELSRKAWTGLTQTAYVSRQLLNGELTPRMFLQKVVARMR
jgi:glycosyltransferase involved in cell wall biosynthesis